MGSSCCKNVNNPLKIPALRSDPLAKRNEMTYKSTIYNQK